MRRRHVRVRSVRVTTAEMAAALGVDASALENALRPLVDRETLRWGKSASGEEQYELVHPDPFLTLLKLVLA